MADKLYDLMDWAGIEAMCIRRRTIPRRILGPRPGKRRRADPVLFPGAGKGDGENT